MDIRNLAFELGAFDVAIDKGRERTIFLKDVPLMRRKHVGTMDAMMTAKGDVWVRTFLLHRYRAHRLLNRIPQKRSYKTATVKSTKSFGTLTPPSKQGLRTLICYRSTASCANQAASSSTSPSASPTSASATSSDQTRVSKSARWGRLSTTTSTSCGLDTGFRKWRNEVA